MRRLVLSLDGLPALREATGSRELDLGAAVTLAELAGVDAIRLGVREDLRPVRGDDVDAVRRTARRLELRMPPALPLVKVALEGRPDRVVLASAGREGGSPAGPLEWHGRAAQLDPVVRALAEAGIPCAALVAPELEAVKRVHAESVPAVEFYTGAIVDLPGAERVEELERLADAVRLASKLGLEIAISGGLSFRNLREVLEACPAVGSVAVGRAALARALLVGLDRALRDLRELLA